MARGQRVVELRLISAQILTFILKGKMTHPINLWLELSLTLTNRVNMVYSNTSKLP